MMVFLRSLNYPVGIHMVGRSLSSVSATPSAAPAPAPAHSVTSPSESMTVDGVTVEKTIGGKAIVRMDRPEALNSFSPRSIPLLASNLANWHSGTNMLLVTSRGKTFSAGGDLKSMAKLNEPNRLSFFGDGYRAFNLLARMPVPSVSLVRGPAFGAGMAMAAYCRFVVASERAFFCLPEAAVGFHVDNGASHYCSKLLSQVGHFLALTGCIITAQDAKRVGIVSHVIDSERMNAIEMELLEMDDPTEEKVMALLDEHEASSGGKKELTLTDEALGLIGECFGEGSVEEVMNRLKHDGSPMAKRCVRAMRTFSPISLKVIHRWMNLGISRPLDQCLRREILISFRMTEEHDFKEGVRAILVDKDKRPAWNPSTLEGVSSEDVERIVSLSEADEHDLAHLFILPGTTSS